VVKLRPLERGGNPAGAKPELPGFKHHLLETETGRKRRSIVAAYSEQKKNVAPFIMPYVLGL
jgi:hypothetical protein